VIHADGLVLRESEDAFGAVVESVEWAGCVIRALRVRTWLEQRRLVEGRSAAALVKLVEERRAKRVEPYAEGLDVPDAMP
jgi:hypothetical protein